MVYAPPTVVAQGPVRDAAGRLRPVEGLECRFATSPDGREESKVVADDQKLAEGLAAAAYRGLNLIAAHQPTGSGGYTLHEAALVSEFMNLAPVLQRVADMDEKAPGIEQPEGPDRELTSNWWRC